MSEENVELARSAFRPGDPSRFFALLDEDVEFDASAYPGPGVVRERGRPTVIAALRRIWGAWDDYFIDAEEYRDAGDDVVMAIYERGTGKGSGASLERRTAQIWSFRDGKITRVRPFRTFDEALEAAGLSE